MCQTNEVIHKPEKVIIRKYLGNVSVVLRSQTTLFASTFHALMHASDVPIRSFYQEEQLNYFDLQSHIINRIE